MYAAPAVLSIATTISLVHPDEAPPLPSEVSQAIERFVPVGRPPDDELSNFAVVIDSASGSTAARAGTPGDDLSRLTGAYLYHWAVMAGGTPIPVDPGEALLPKDGLSDFPSRRTAIGRIGETTGTIVLSIRYGDACGEAVAPAGEAAHRGDPQADAALADCLRRALDRGGARGAEVGAARESTIEHAVRVSGSQPGRLAACAVRLDAPSDNLPSTIQCREQSLHTARALYSGLSDFCATRRALAAPQGRSHDEGDKQGAEPAADDARTVHQAGPSSRLATLIWPDGRLPDDKVDWFCRMYSRLAVTDRSLVHFAVEGSVVEGVVVLRGATNAPSVVRGLIQALRTVGFEQIRDEVRTLPDRDRLGGELFGACRVPQALTFSRPGESGDVQTELLFGEPVFLLDRQSGDYLLHAGDGYWGWVRQEAIATMTADQFAEYTNHRRGVLLADYADGRIRIPLGAVVPVEPGAGLEVSIVLPEGGRLQTPPALVRLDGPDPDSLASERVKAALDLRYAPYVFGGRSALGLDCSGLMTQLGALAGETTARDAWQQAFAGSMTATWWHQDGIRPGDQLFFINPSGKIYHTGVAISPTHVVHAAPPYVQIGSLKPEDRLYDPRLDRDFFMAKRP